MTHQVTTLLSLALTSMKVCAVLTPPKILPAQMTFPITYMVILDEVGVSLGRILLIHTSSSSSSSPLGSKHSSLAHLEHYNSAAPQTNGHRPDAAK